VNLTNIRGFFGDNFSITLTKIINSKHFAVRGLAKNNRKSNIIPPLFLPTALAFKKQFLDPSGEFNQCSGFFGDNFCITLTKIINSKHFAVRGLAKNNRKSNIIPPLFLPTALAFKTQFWTLLVNLTNILVFSGIIFVSLWQAFKKLLCVWVFIKKKFCS
jgi:hypothetical protein